jgi:hypothetical protein
MQERSFRLSRDLLSDANTPGAAPGLTRLGREVHAPTPPSRAIDNRMHREEQAVPQSAGGR